MVSISPGFSVVADTEVLADKPKIMTELDDTLYGLSGLRKDSTDLVGVTRQLQAELTREGLPEQPSSQVGVGLPEVCVYVGQKVVANEKYRGSATFLRQLSSLQSGFIGRSVDTVPEVVAD